MKYHYQIVSKTDPTDIFTTSDAGIVGSGFNTKERALTVGQEVLDLKAYHKEHYEVKVIPVEDDIQDWDVTKHSAEL
jgi:hypothetical protein